MRTWLKRYRLALGFVIVMIALAVGAWQYTEQATSNLRQNAVEACRKDNATNAELAGFLRDAAAAREDDGQPDVADQYRDRAAVVEAQIVNCIKENS